MKSCPIYLCLSLLLLNWTIIGASTPIKQCVNSNSPLPLMVQVDNCNQLPCELMKGTESNITIQFVATRNAMAQLLAEVRLTSLGMTIPYELEQSRQQVCQNLLHGAYCPLDAGEDVTYQLRLPVAEHLPEVPTRLQVTLLDALNGAVVACFTTDTRVKKASSHRAN